MKRRKPAPGAIALGILGVVAFGKVVVRGLARAESPPPETVCARPPDTPEPRGWLRPVEPELASRPVARETAPTARPREEPTRARLVACLRRLARAQGLVAVFDPAAEAIARAAATLGREGFLALVDEVEDDRAPLEARVLACGLLEGLRERDPAALVALSCVTHPRQPAAVRRAAVRALAVLAPARFRALFLERAADADALVRLQALIGLARDGDGEALALLEATAASTAPGEVLAASLGALHAVDSERARDALERLRKLVAPDARPIVSLLLAMQGRRSPAIDADVRAAARDEEHPERRALAQTLARR